MKVVAEDSFLSSCQNMEICMGLELWELGFELGCEE